MAGDTLSSYKHLIRHRMIGKVVSVAAFLLVGHPCVSFLVAPSLNTSRRKAFVPSALSSSEDYLSSLSSGDVQTLFASRAAPLSAPLPRQEQATSSSTPESSISSLTTFSHAPFSYFTLDKLTPKGPRKNADVGQPHDATRPLTTIGSTSVGSWWCAAGGWPSPAQRATTEVFFVFSGQGCLTDLDGMRHEFGPGDTVVLPKGWSGRWDILQPIHKVWVVHDHPNVEETSNPIRVVVTRYGDIDPQHLTPQGVRPDTIHGSPNTASRTFYDVGPTSAGCWSCTPGSFPVSNRATTECFHVLEGVFFLTNADGSARRCVAGDTVVLPKGWSGCWDVIETVRKIWVVVD